MMEISRRAGFAALILAAAFSGAAFAQATVYKQGEMPGCLKATEQHLPGNIIIGTCVDSKKHFSGVYFGDESEAYIKWLGIQALHEEGLTLTRRGKLAKIDSKGHILQVYGETQGVPDDLRDAVGSNSSPDGNTSAASEEYAVLEKAFRSHLDRTVTVPPDDTDPSLLRTLE